jgi:glycine cleavage system protein P-like pyridoxal-binding family
MTKIEHSLKFVTEFDETHPIAQQALSIPHSDLIAMLEGMLKELVAPALTSVLDEINARGTYAILKVAE